MITKLYKKKTKTYIYRLGSDATISRNILVVAEKNGGGEKFYVLYISIFIYLKKNHYRDGGEQEESTYAPCIVSQ